MRALKSYQPWKGGRSGKRIIVEQGLFACGPKELWERERMHLHALLLGRDDDAFDVLADGYERSCLQIIVTAIRHEVLYGLS